MSIQFSIMLAAKDVKHALAIRDSLISNGVSANAITSGIARAASPSVANDEKGPHEIALCEYLGITNRRATLNGNMQANFGLSGTREQMAEKFLSLLQSGKVIKTKQGYKHAGGNSVTPSNEDIDSEDDIDLDDPQ